MQYCSLQHQALLPSPVTSTTECRFCFDSISSFFLELFLNIIYNYLFLHFILNITFGCAGLDRCAGSSPVAVSWGSSLVTCVSFSLWCLLVVEHAPQGERAQLPWLLGSTAQAQ